MLVDVIIYGGVLILVGAIAYLAWELTIGSNRRRKGRDDDLL